MECQYCVGALLKRRLLDGMGPVHDSFLSLVVPSSRVYPSIDFCSGMDYGSIEAGGDHLNYTFARCMYDDVWGVPVSVDTKNGSSKQQLSDCLRWY